MTPTNDPTTAAPEARLPSISRAFAVYRRQPLLISGAALLSFLAFAVAKAAFAAAVPPGAFAAISGPAVTLILCTLVLLFLFHLAAAAGRGDLSARRPPRIDLVRFAEGIKGAAFLYLLLLPALLAGVAGRELLVLSTSDRLFWTAETAVLGGVLLLGAFGFWVLLCFRSVFLPVLTAESGAGFLAAWRRSRELAQAMPEKLPLLMARLAALNLPLVAIAWLGPPYGPPALLGLAVTAPLSALAVADAAHALSRHAATATARPRASVINRLAGTCLLLAAGAAAGLLIRESGLTADDERQAMASLRLLTSEFVESDPGIATAEGFRPLSGVEIAAHRIVGVGTGFFIDDRGDLITNFHVVSPCRLIATRVGKYVATARIAAVDPAADLALLKIAVKNTHHVPIPAGQTYRLGQQFFTFGWANPGGGTVALDTSGQFQTGLLNATRGMNNDERYFQISAPLNPGNSGGAILDTFGMLAGVASQSLSSIGNPGISFGIKHDTITNFLASSRISYDVAAPAGEMSPEAIAQIVSPASRRLFCMK